MHIRSSAASLAVALTTLAACGESSAPVSPDAPELAALPVRAASWTTTAGPAGATGLAAHGATVWAATELEGLFRSDDGGQTWENGSTGLPEGTGGSDVVRAAGGVLWLGTAAGVYRSDDGGASWAFAGLADQSVRVVAVDQAGRVFAGASGWYGGVFRSTDGGATWEKVMAAVNPRDFIVEFLAPAGDAVFLGTWADDVWRGRKDGTEWEWMGGAFATLPHFMPPVADLRATPGGALLATWFGGIARSTDGGDSWTQVFGPASAGPLTADAQGRLYAHLQQGRVVMSLDDGLTWIPITRPLAGPVLALAVADGRLLASTWDGLFAAELPGR